MPHTVESVTSVRQGNMEDQEQNNKADISADLKEQNEGTTEVNTSTSESSSAVSTPVTVITTACSQSSSNEPSTSATSVVKENTCFVPPTARDMEKSGGQYVGPPPAYRTATLVFKLLQIGTYQIRSFSEVNPNRLRVLFNTQ